jgi:thioredoxin 1
MSNRVKDISDTDFKSQVLETDRPTLVDFWATWCAPCKAIAPVVEELAETYEGKVNFVKINIDDNQNTPSQYGVRGIPTLILFKNGEVMDQVVGNVPKDQLVSLIERGL